MRNTEYLYIKILKDPKEEENNHDIYFVVCHMSRVMCHILGLSFHLSHITDHLTTTLCSFNCYASLRRFGDAAARSLMIDNDNFFIITFSFLTKKNFFCKLLIM